MERILVLNSGSTTVKFQLFQMNGESCKVIAQGVVERIGQNGSKVTIKSDIGEYNKETPIADHKDAIKSILDYIFPNILKDVSELSAVGHRMGHGGEDYDKSVIIDETVIKRIYDNVPLLPLHGPAFVHGLEAILELLPNVLQVAAFDNAYHQSMDKSAYTYAIPKEYYEKERIRRYGFHGTSHNYAGNVAADLLGYKGKFICCHLGGGSSITAMNNGKSVDTTMGYTPFAGIMMSTRSGDMDPYIPLHIMKTQNKTADEVNQMFNKESGLYGLTGGHSDMRDIIEQAELGDEQCEFGIKAYVYNLLKYIGSYVAVLGGIDALIFTAGIGENSSKIRQMLCEKLSYLGIKLDETANSLRPAPQIISAEDSKVKVLVIPASEELMIAKETYELLEEVKKAEKIAV
jgi:acetate kinase